MSHLVHHVNPIAQQSRCPEVLCRGMIVQSSEAKTRCLLIQIFHAWFSSGPSLRERRVASYDWDGPQWGLVKGEIMKEGIAAAMLRGYDGRREEEHPHPPGASKSTTGNLFSRPSASIASVWSLIDFLTWGMHGFITTAVPQRIPLPLATALSYSYLHSFPVLLPTPKRLNRHAPATVKPSENGARRKRHFWSRT